MSTDDASETVFSEPFNSSGRLDPRFVRPRRLAASTSDWIERELEDYYREILQEPVPQRLLALIDQQIAQRVLH